MDKYKMISESENETIVDLRRIIGITNTIAIVEKCGGAFIYIPQMKTLEKAERDKAIYSDYESGVGFQKLALKYSLAQATIRDIVNKERRNRHGRKQEQRSGAVRAGAGNRITGAAESSGTEKPVTGAGAERTGTD